MIQELTFDEVELVDGASLRSTIHAIAVAVEAGAAIVAALTE